MKVSSLLKWPYWRFRQPWSDHVKQFDYLDWETQRKLAYKQIDKGGFGYWTVFVAGAGFLTDAYDIFAVNTVLPMLEVVYWNGDLNTNREVLVSLSMLVGTLVGQLMFGLLADRYGRKRMYGVELIVLTVATILMAIASKGALNSTNRLAWIIAWRFIMGIGVGGDYPLSAVITAEFAPRKHRDRMLSTLFFMQPIGALLANIVTVIAITTARGKIPPNTSATNCTGECAKAVDSVWRLIVGIGAIPPALGILLRWWIPESPRYTLEVEKDPKRASIDVNAYYQTEPAVLRSPRSGPEADDEIRTDDASGGFSELHGTLTFGEPHELKDFNDPNMPPSSTTMVRKETWKEFFVGFYTFMIHEGNWTDLAGTSLAWLTLDFAFYCLSINSPKVLSKLWKEEQKTSVYHMLIGNGYRALIAVSSGAIIGGAAFIMMARYRWYLQVYGFWILALAFITTGVCFVTLLGSRYFAAVIVLYSICNLFVNFGPNTSTFVIAAEVFPTKYRSTCHGISAAAGKFGSIMAQIFLAYARFGSVTVNAPHSTWLGWVFIIFTVFMAFGAIITKVWVPNPADLWGRSRRLEDLGRGKAARKRLEREEREVWEEFVSRNLVG